MSMKDPVSALGWRRNNRTCSAYDEIPKGPGHIVVRCCKGEGNNKDGILNIVVLSLEN